MIGRGNILCLYSWFQIDEKDDDEDEYFADVVEEEVAEDSKETTNQGCSEAPEDKQASVVQKAITHKGHTTVASSWIHRKNCRW